MFLNNPNKSKYTDINIGDFVKTLGACGNEMFTARGGYTCKVVGKNIEGQPKPNIVIENFRGKQTTIHSFCGEAYFEKVNSYLG